MKKNLSKIFSRMVKFLSRGLGLSRFRLVAWVYGKISGKLKTPEAQTTIRIPELGEFKMNLDSKDSLSLSVFGIYEEFETSFLGKKIKPGMNVVDVGANIGYYTVIFSRLVGEKGKVFAFEPDPENFGILKSNMELNDCENVVVEQKALSETAGEIKLYLNEENRGDHRIYNPGGSRNFVEIEAVRLDDAIVDNLAEIELLKMDVQGAEVLVLRGARKMLKSSASLMIVSEFWPYAIEKAGCDPAEFFQILADNNFEIFNIDAVTKEIRPIINTEEFIKKCSGGANGGANVFAVKK